MTSPARLRVRIVACTLFFLFLNFYALFHNFPQALSGEADFRSFYAAGAIVRSGQAADLYQYDLERTVQNALVSSHPGALPFLYPAYAALPFVPLSALPYRIAYLVFLAGNVALLLWAARLMRFQLRGLARLFAGMPTLLFLAFLPVAIAFYQGQVSLLLLVLFCGAHVALRRERLFLAGILLSLALIKFHVVLPVILLFVIWRMWRLILGFAVGAAALALTCVAVQGLRGVSLYVGTLISATSRGAIGVQNSYTVFSAKMPNLHGLWFLLLGTSHWTIPLVLISSIAVLLWTALQPPSLARALVAGLLVSYHLHLHDLTLLLLPVALVLNEAVAAYTSHARQRQRVVTLTSVLWLISPVGLYLIATGANGLFALAMVPLLLASQTGAFPTEPTKAESPASSVVSAMR